MYKSLFFLCLTWLALPANADLSSIQCPGNSPPEKQYCSGLKWAQETHGFSCPGKYPPETRYCARLKSELSHHLLEEKLSPVTLSSWRKATQEVCAAAHAPGISGTSYPRLILECDYRLDRVLIEELD